MSLHKAQTGIAAEISRTLDDLLEYECDHPCSPELYDATLNYFELLRAIRANLDMAAVQASGLRRLKVMER